MRWKYCEDCYINGHCENQDRGLECNVYAKRITDKCERLQKQLDIAVKCLKEYGNFKNWSSCKVIHTGDNSVNGYYKDFGNSEAEQALLKINELNK